ncbi:MAG: hypothetical protein SYC29_05270, partial [Planctomycetota bacterium]|nr:hypothetical protein [Planctomycetota bacterium]
ALTPARARRRPRLRAGKQLGVWTPVQLVLMFVFGAGMAVATLYWMGIVSTTRELHIREKFNRIESERLQREAEEQAILIEKKWDEAEAVMLELVEMTEAQMEDGHLRDAAELLISLEEIYHQVARHKPGVMDAFSETRLDDVVMPSLRRIYNVERLGGAEILEDVRSRLAELEKQRAEQVRANQAQEGD